MFTLFDRYGVVLRYSIFGNEYLNEIMGIGGNWKNSLTPLTQLINERSTATADFTNH